MNASGAGDPHGGMREPMIFHWFCKGFEQKEHDVLFAPHSGMRKTMVSIGFIGGLEQKEHDVLFAFAGNA